MIADFEACAPLLTRYARRVILPRPNIVLTGKKKD
jgi:hypothetical protein